MVDAALQGLELDDLDASAKQRLASDPSVCVWVGASAGTGKTKVLTDRVLRLLLPQEDGRAGSPAHKILCLTFTKAGASEMLLRISRILARWAVAPEGDLVQDLDSLYGRAVRAEEIAAARRLFADVVDVPGGLKIMTIHSFCQ
jgi:ATP-dependent helicase/nuclease subunit A